MPSMPDEQADPADELDRAATRPRARPVHPLVIGLTALAVLVAAGVLMSSIEGILS